MHTCTNACRYTLMDGHTHGEKTHKHTHTHTHTPTHTHTHTKTHKSPMRQLARGMAAWEVLIYIFTDVLKDKSFN